uniref:Phage Tail Collar domain protein n=1 Tax=Solibacter usitatus (strain Ellin6076) TaxID=234267 RepID=Q02CQ1_SOLUE
MATPFISEIKLFSFGFAPKGWAMCNGQLLPINQNQALFSLLGTTYGGDGRVNFALPNLQGRVPMHMGNGHTLGERGGEQNHTLIMSEMPAHTHTPTGCSDQANLTTPSGSLWGKDASSPYAASGNAAMLPADIIPVGGSQPHQNMSPFLTLNFCIALQGIFPSQN